MKATAAISIAALVAALAATPSMSLDLNAGVGANAGVTASSDDDTTNVDAGLGVDVNVSAQGDDGTGVSADGSVAGDVSVETGDGDLGVDTNATGAINANAGDVNARLDALVSLINEADYDESSFSAWADASSTTIIDVNDLFDLDGKARIDAAIKANLDEHNDLSAAIEANAKLKAWLDSNGIDASSVIAIDVSADGSVDVYEG